MLACTQEQKHTEHNMISDAFSIIFLSRKNSQTVCFSFYNGICCLKLNASAVMISCTDMELRNIFINVVQGSHLLRASGTMTAPIEECRDVNGVGR